MGSFAVCSFPHLSRFSAAPGPSTVCPGGLCLHFWPHSRKYSLCFCSVNRAPMLQVAQAVCTGTQLYFQGKSLAGSCRDCMLLHCICRGGCRPSCRDDANFWSSSGMWPCCPPLLEHQRSFPRAWSGCLPTRVIQVGAVMEACWGLDLCSNTLIYLLYIWYATSVL